MVDFDNETTVATPAKDVMRIYLLQNKAYVEDTWRAFRKGDFAGVDKGLADVRAAIEQLYLIMECIIERHWKEEDIKKEDILKIIETANKSQLLDLIIRFNRILDKTTITRLDTKRAPQRTWEKANTQHGY